MKPPTRKALAAFSRDARKAIAAFLLPALGAAGASMRDGNLTGAEIITALGFGLATGVTVYKVENLPT